jgi:hypothetical protein
MQIIAAIARLRRQYRAQSRPNVADLSIKAHHRITMSCFGKTKADLVIQDKRHPSPEPISDLA